jgi:hypothetical protein
LRSMLTKTYVAAVGNPVLVDIPRWRAMAWYARKMNDMASIRKMRRPSAMLSLGFGADGFGSAGMAVFSATADDFLGEGNSQF